MKSAQTLADVAAAYLHNAQARENLHDSVIRSREFALHDSLTGLPNRTLLLERLDHAMLRCRRSKQLAAVLFVDLDQFKSVNDRFGHSVGDELLIAVAERLSTTVRPSDTVARMSGDEFVILCEDLEGHFRAGEIAARVGTAIAEPFVLSGHEIGIAASVGIAFSGPGMQLSEHLLAEADTAMYQAKRHGGGRQQIVDLQEQERSDHLVELERELNGAAARGELRTVYQPVVDIGDGRVTGVEALLRWDSPSQGSVPPSVLIPVAEKGGQIDAIGEWVLEQACDDLHRWQHAESGANELAVSVNVSAHQLMSKGYASGVASMVTRFMSDPSLLTLEMTESVFIQDAERALVVLNELKCLGVLLALDDFGTGYSSLSYLKRFPFDIVKIGNHRPGPPAWLEGRRRGRGDGHPVRGPRLARLRRLPGLLLRPAHVSRLSRRDVLSACGQRLRVPPHAGNRVLSTAPDSASTPTAGTTGLEHCSVDVASRSGYSV
jgi:diguanylate cyclase (GGDEF)-like protein